MPRPREDTLASSEEGRIHPYRKAYSCTPCRSKKIKCGRQRFCEQCVKKGIECIWPANGVPLIQPNSTSVSPSYDQTSTPGAGPSTPLGLPRSTNSIRAAPYRSSPSPNHTRLQHSTRSPRQAELVTSPVAGIPHTVALAEQFDHSILNDALPAGQGDQRTPHERDVISDDHARHDGGISRGSTPAVSRYPFGRRGRGEGDGLVTERLLEALPMRYRADILLRFYLERVEWIHHPLHLPTFLSQYNRFWQLDTASRCRTVHSRWLALLYIILCLGVYFGEEEARDEGLLAACQDCLSHSDFLNQSSLEGIQTIICLNLYLNNNDQSSAAKSFLGLAIKMAIMLGLSRIPDEKDLKNPVGQIEREIGRRLWWSLFCQDAYTASNTGFTYSIQAGHFTTGLFANVDDEEIGESVSIPADESGSGSVHRTGNRDRITVSTYHLAKIEFALIVRDFIDAINLDFPNASYDSILALDARFRRAYDKLPCALRPDLEQPFDIAISGSRRYLFEQRLFMGITLHNRIMRLHRAYMRKGYSSSASTSTSVSASASTSTSTSNSGSRTATTSRPTDVSSNSESRYAYSTRACIESALELLDLARQSRVLCRWWVVVVHIWTAGLILSADSLRVDMSVKERARNREGVELAVGLLEPMSKSSPVAARGIRILKSLLEDEVRRRSVVPLRVGSAVVQQPSRRSGQVTIRENQTSQTGLRPRSPYATMSKRITANPIDSSNSFPAPQQHSVPPPSAPPSLPIPHPTNTSTTLDAPTNPDTLLSHILDPTTSFELDSSAFNSLFELNFDDLGVVGDGAGDAQLGTGIAGGLGPDIGIGTGAGIDDPDWGFWGQGTVVRDHTTGSQAEEGLGENGIGAGQARLPWES